MKIEKYLILNKYFLSLFGIRDFRDLQLKLKDTKEGTDSDGRTHFVNALIGLEGLKINEDDLLRYDKNIQEYERKINHRRGNVSLKYFQYLAVLFTEIFLDNLKKDNIFSNNSKNETPFLSQLNDFLTKYKESLLLNEFSQKRKEKNEKNLTQKRKEENVKDLISSFTEDDLRKLAFWMATGSGKTLIAHINYYQFFKYNIFLT